MSQDQDKKQLFKVLQWTVLALATVAIIGEIRKPPEVRRWHGKVAGLVPYDFRPPTLRRIKNTFWNAGESRILIPGVFGIGWAINFYALCETLRLIDTGIGSEIDFLMPNTTIKKVMLGERR